MANATDIDRNLLDASREVLELLANVGLDWSAAYLALLKATDAKAREMEQGREKAA